jgi:phenylacetate-CoA ligase
MSVFTLIRCLLESKIHEKYSRERINRLQEKKFRKIIKFAYKNSKFYHDLYNLNGIKEKDLKNIDIEKIPIINKSVLMDNFDEIVTFNDILKNEILDFLNKSKEPNELYKNKYHIIHTSGSSGKLGIYVYSKKEWDTFFPYITKIFNFNFRKNRSSFIGATGGHFTGNSFISWSVKGIVGYFCEPLIIDVNEPIEDIIKKLNEFQPYILGGYFNALKVLAQKHEEGVLKVKPKIIVNCGEGINKKDKEYIEKIFNAPMSNLYGFAECVVAGFGRNEYDGIYLMDDICLIEIKKDYLLLTNLFNKTEPIIRYRIDDFLKLKDDKKKLLPFTLVDDIIGRVECIIWFENDHGKMDFIHPLIFTDFYVKDLDKLQIVIKSKNSFIFRAVINSNDKERVVKDIKNKLDIILTKKNFTNVKYNIELVNDLKSDEKTGKFRLIVNEN